MQQLAHETISLYNLFQPDLLANPYPFYHRLRAEHPVYWDSMMHSWVLTRYTDVMSALHNPRLSEERISGFLEQLIPERREKLAPLAHVLIKMMLFQDPPHHTRLRSIMGKAFTPRSIEGMRARIQQQTDELLDRVQATGRMDVIHDFAAPLSAAVVADLLDVPETDRHQFMNWNSLLKEFFTQSMRGVETITNLKKYFSTVVMHPQNRPGKHLLGILLDAYDHQTIDSDELFSAYVLLFDAGQVTTTNLIGNGVLALLRHPDQLEKLRATPSLIAPAVSELLRYDGPVQFTTRIAREDIWIEQTRMKKGQSVTLILGAANRDSKQFPNPDTLDISRENNRNLAFGYGLHFCLGAALALQEAQIAIGTLLRRMPGIRLTSEPRWQEDINFRFLHALPLAFD